LFVRRFLLIPGVACLPALFHKPVKEIRQDPRYLYETELRSAVDSIRVIKRRREMQVFHGDSLLKIYRVAPGDMPGDHKHFKGDEHTPEELYRINDRNPYSPSQFFLKSCIKYGRGRSNLRSE
jgi:hypothetical protein